MDLRERVIAAYDRGDGSTRQLAEVFGVSGSWIRKLLRLRRERCSIAAVEYKPGPKRRLTGEQLDRLCLLVAEEPDLTAEEVRRRGHGYSQGNQLDHLPRIFVEEFFCPTLSPGDVVVMDNLAVRKVKGVDEAIRSVGARPLYLPPYSPNLNPIEQVWSTVKSWVRQESPRTFRHPRHVDRPVPLTHRPLRGLQLHRQHRLYAHTYCDTALNSVHDLRVSERFRYTLDAIIQMHPRRSGQCRP